MAKKRNDVHKRVQNLLSTHRKPKSVREVFEQLGDKPVSDHQGHLPFRGAMEDWEGVTPRGGSYPGQGFSNWYGGGGTGGPYKGSQSGSPQQIMVVKKDGTMGGPYTLGSNDWDWWEVVSKVWPPAGNLMHIPEDKVEYSYERVSFNPCTFDATSDYLQARWGRKLHDTDKVWLGEHPFSTDAGVPQEYTAICLHGLVEPYGMGISRVRVRAGLVVLGPELEKFATALGCNPIGLVDHSSDNSAFVAQVKAAGGDMTLEQANALFRFEFSEDPLPCSVVCEEGWTNSSTVQTGSFGGHARFLAPRARAGNWKLSLQLAPLNECQYRAAIPAPNYVPRRGPAKLLLDGVKRPDGAQAAVKHNGWWYSPEEAKDRKDNSSKYSGSGYSPRTSGTVQSTTPQSSKTGLASMVKCPRCTHHVIPFDIVDGSNICIDCWENVWIGFACGKCKTKFTRNNTPTFKAIDRVAGTTTFDCANAKCEHQIVVKWDKNREECADLVELCEKYCGMSLTEPKKPEPSQPAKREPVKRGLQKDIPERWASLTDAERVELAMLLGVTSKMDLFEGFVATPLVERQQLRKDVIGMPSDLEIDSAIDLQLDRREDAKLVASEWAALPPEIQEEIALAGACWPADIAKVLSLGPGEREATASLGLCLWEIARLIRHYTTPAPAA